MILGESMLQVPPWQTSEESLYSVAGYSAGSDFSSFLLSDAAMAAIQRFLPDRRRIEEEREEEDDGEEVPLDAYTCDEFRMYEFKVRRCVRGRSHDWTECPYAHPGEKARRRDPRKFNYSGVACPDFRKGACKRGDACEYAHGVFECWLHPSRYRTQACKDGVNCRRRVCFFAHTPDQLRAVSPPMSPQAESPVGDLLGSLRRLQLSKASSAPSSWALGSPRSAASSPRASSLSDWAEPAERVESGRSLRAKIYGKLSREFSMGRDEEEACSMAPDVAWVSDLIM
ncbi:zinc finger CCCH domain-containing protein 20-like [Wolffia australiana]